MDKPWEMPEWMKPYCETVLMGNDQKEVERLVNNSTAVQINAPLALHACNIKGRVSALESLKEQGLLKIGEEND